MRRLETLERRARQVQQERQKDLVDIEYDDGTRKMLDLYEAMDIAALPGAPKVVRIYGEQTDGIMNLLRMFEEYERPVYNIRAEAKARIESESERNLF